MSLEQLSGGIGQCIVMIIDSEDENAIAKMTYTVKGFTFKIVIGLEDHIDEIFKDLGGMI